jgi:hypothetical protein
MSVIKRGRILRDTSLGEGLVFVDGNQYPFRLESLWKSEYAPKVNMAVDAEFDDQGRLIALRSASSQSAGGEQAAQAVGAAQEAAKKFAADFQARGLPVIIEQAQKIGYPTLGAFAAVVLGWFFLPAASMNMGFLGKNSVTFYQGLKLLNASGLEGMAALAGGGSAGFYGFLAFVSLLAVFLPQFWKDKRAVWGMAAPLALMLLVAALAYFKISSQYSEAQEAAAQFGGAEYQQMAKQMADQAAAEMRKAISIGFGTYLALIGAAYLAWLGFVRSRSGTN